MTTVFHLLRHASHGHLGTILTGRQPGVALSRAGRGEARALARHLAAFGLDAVYTSPRLRARETAAIVAVCAGVRCAVASELDEIDFGRWSGMAFADLAGDAAWACWNGQRDVAATPAGETMAGVAARVCALLERLRLQHAGGAVALVSHGDVIKAGLCRCLGWPFRSVHDFEIGPASLTTLELDGDHARLDALDIRTAPSEAGAAA